MTILHAAAVQRQIELPANKNLMLSLGTGTLAVTDQGILARLTPPLAKLSGYYPWAFLPRGIAALKLLVVDDTGIAGAIADRFGLSPEDRDLLDRKIGRLQWTVHDGLEFVEHDSDLVDDVERIMRWGVGLAEKCPDPRVACDLVRLSKMQSSELQQFAMGG